MSFATPKGHVMSQPGLNPELLQTSSHSLRV